MSAIAPALVSFCLDFSDKNNADSSPLPVGLPGVSIVRSRRVETIATAIHLPLICLVLQGAKEIRRQNRAVRFAAGETAIVSHELVAQARIVTASPQAPYVAVACEIDLELLRSLHDEISADAAANAQADAHSEAVAVAAAEKPMVQTMARLLDLIDKPLEQRVLSPLVRRELHFRALTSPNGAMMRQLVHDDSHASRIAKAIAHIRRNWDLPIRTRQLAEIAGMSGSSLHEHFKAVTATSPLQYQKSLRLLEARRRLMETNEPVSTIAFAVGYESPTQFSRDYRRAYGGPPRGDRRLAQSEKP